MTKAASSTERTNRFISVSWWLLTQVSRTPRACVEIFADDGLYAHGLLSFVPGGLRRLAATGDVSVEVARL